MPNIEPNHHVSSVRLMAQNVKSGLIIVKSIAWITDDTRARTMAEMQSKREDISHVQIRHAIKDKAGNLVEDQFESIKGDPEADLWRVTMVNDEDRFALYWDCLATNAEEAARMAENANPSMRATYQAQIHLSDRGIDI